MLRERGKTIEKNLELGLKRGYTVEKGRGEFAIQFFGRELVLKAQV